MTTVPAGRSESLNQLLAKLKEMFQLDRGDLDFGIYRIMNFRRAEIERFLDRELPERAKEIVRANGLDDPAVELRRELEEAISAARKAGFDPESSPRVQELRASIARAGNGPNAVLDEVYSALDRFFRRYYDEGDFIAQRRGRDGIYLIPYEGEEVKLHWANKDQYYVKSSENFSNYTFRLDDGKGPAVRFRVVAAESLTDNNKEAKGKQRRFRLAPDDTPGGVVAEEDGDLVVRFTYTADEADKRRQDALNADSAERLLALLAAKGMTDWAKGLTAAAPTEGNQGRRLLDKHLTQFTFGNSFDYFIHKDLKGFLTRELDTFINQEILNHRALAAANRAGRMEQVQATLAKADAVEKIAGTIITFVSELEEFQKRLWLKKKFVLETQWCVTLDRIPDSFYPEIAANEDQREEWVKLFAIDEIVADELGKVAYSAPLSADFLKANPFLVLDTKHFDKPGSDFKARLIAEIDDVDERMDGLLVHGENFGALSLLTERYRSQATTVYFDPPYNTGNDGFIYKDNFQHSTWLALIQDRALQALPILASDGVLMAACDDGEEHRLRAMIEPQAGPFRFLTNLVWKSRINVDSRNASNVSNDHEFVVCFGKKILGGEKDLDKYSNPDNDQRGPWMSDNMVGLATRVNRPNLHYRIAICVVQPYAEYDLSFRVSLAGKQLEVRRELVYGVLPEAEEICFCALSFERDEVLAASQIPSPLDGRKIPVGVFPCPNKGWRYDPASMARRVYENRILWPSDTTGRPRKKTYREELKSDYTGFSSVIVSTADGTNEINSMFQSISDFPFPKPSELIEELVIQGDKGSCGLTLDFFGGTGTSAHAVINLNRKTDERRRFALVEVAHYFDQVTLPRTKKAIYSSEWKSGRPVSRDGISHAFKYIRLESYEDTLDNLKLERFPRLDDLLTRRDREAGDGRMSPFRVEYMLSHMIRNEAKGPSLLDLDRIADPTAYTMTILRDGREVEQTVDLVETFNWLLGLRVKKLYAPRTYRAAFHRDAMGRLTLARRPSGRLNRDAFRADPAGPYWFRLVEGTLPTGEDAVIIWRRLTGDIEADNLALDGFAEISKLNARDSEVRVVYVNGDNNLQNLRLAPTTDDDGGGDTAEGAAGEEAPPIAVKVRLIEQDFHRLMFADSDERGIV